MAAVGQGQRIGMSELVPVYEWFIVGFETADLQKAKALL